MEDTGQLKNCSRQRKISETEKKKIVFQEKQYRRGEQNKNLNKPRRRRASNCEEIIFR